MPYPLPKGRNFSITYLQAPATHHMPTMCACCDFYELSFLIQGERKSVTSTGIYFMHPGAVTLTEPDQLHQTSSIGNEPYTRILIKVSNTVVNQIRQQLGVDLFDNLCAEHIHYFRDEKKEQIKNLFFEMLHEYDNYTGYTDALLTGMLLHLFVLIDRWKVAPERPRLKVEILNNNISKALRYIDCHADEDLSLSQTAAYVGLAPAYFSRLFKQVTGTTYSDYVSILKLLFARNLIMQTHMTMNEIALETGYGNGNYLSNVFHKHFHMSPTEYKKMYRDSDSYPD